MSDVATILGHLIPISHTEFSLATSSRSSEITSVKTSAYTITIADRIIRVDTSEGAFNLQLPDPTLKWFGYIQDVAGSLSTNQVSLLQYASEKINNIAATRKLYGDYNVYLVYSDGTNWWLS